MGVCAWLCVCVGVCLWLCVCVFVCVCVCASSVLSSAASNPPRTPDFNVVMRHPRVRASLTQPAPPILGPDINIEVGGEGAGRGDVDVR